MRVRWSVLQFHSYFQSSACHVPSNSDISSGAGIRTRDPQFLALIVCWRSLPTTVPTFHFSATVSLSQIASLHYDDHLKGDFEICLKYFCRNAIRCAIHELQTCLLNAFANMMAYVLLNFFGTTDVATKLNCSACQQFLVAPGRISLVSFSSGLFQ